MTTAFGARLLGLAETATRDAALLDDWRRPARSPSTRAPSGAVSDPTGETAVDPAHLHAATAARDVRNYLDTARASLAAVLGPVAPRGFSALVEAVEARIGDTDDAFTDALVEAYELLYDASLMVEDTLAALDPGDDTTPTPPMAPVEDAEPAPRPEPNRQAVEAAVECVQRFEPVLRQWARKALDSASRPSTVDVDDLLQETYAVAVSRASTTVDDGTPVTYGDGFAALMFRVASRHLLSRVPREAALDAIADTAVPAWSPAVESDLLPEDEDSLIDAVDDLSPRYRALAYALARRQDSLDVRFLQDAVAAVDGKRPTVRAVENLRHRLYRRLRRTLSGAQSE